jgi:hypothetical protein
VKLEDLKNNPLLISKNLKIKGPNGLKGTATVTVSTPVITEKRSDLFQETVTLIRDAVVDAHASIDDPTGELINVTSTGTANCYWLPWASGKIYLGQLGGSYEYFFTYTINGCGVMIGGTETNPIVGHANLESKRLDAAAEKAAAFAKDRSKYASAAQEAAKEQALIYDHFYGNLAAQLIHDELMSGARLEVVTPQQYLIDAGAGWGAVFGIQAGGRWAFYGNWAQKTRKIWP